MAKRLIAMQCGERSLGHLSLVFGLLAVGTLSLSVATDFWLFTTEALDPSLIQSELFMHSPQSPSSDDDVYDYEELNITAEMGEDVAAEMDMSYQMPSVIIAKLHSGLWRTCTYFDDQGMLNQSINQ